MRSHPDFPRIARAIARLPRRAWSGVAYRSVSPARAGARDLLSGEGVRRWGGRWNAAGSFAAVYASLSPETAIAEALAHSRYYGIPDADAMPRVVVALDASLTTLLDLTDGSARRILRASRRRLRSEPWRRAAEAGREALTQAIGRAALAAGLEALLVPSAADRAGSNLVVFPASLRAQSRLALRPGPES
ncbi:MAG TPA: RES family NAD+ phosphorylase [Thermoanaerobaculia bacterium]|jgi:RES domain-containing protein